MTETVIQVMTHIGFQIQRERSYVITDMLPDRLKDFVKETEEGIHKDFNGRKFRSKIQCKPTRPEEINLTNSMGKGTDQVKRRCGIFSSNHDKGCNKRYI